MTLVERREEIARLIEPYAWSVKDQCDQLGHLISNRNGGLVEDSLAKADAILGGEGPDGPFAGEALRKSEGGR